MHKAGHLALLVALLGPLVAAAAPGTAPLTAAQSLSYVRIGDLQFSPDGSELAFVASSYQWDAQPHVRIMRIATGETHELTPAGKSERAPQWAPDGGSLAFLSNRGGKNEIYLVSAAGGDARALTSRKFGVDRFRWSPNGRQLAYLAKEDTAVDPGEGPQVADLDRNLPRLWIMDVATGASRVLAGAGYRMADFQWQDDGELLVLASHQAQTEGYTYGLYRVAAGDGVLRALVSEPRAFEGLLVAPDRKGFAIRAPAVGGPAARDLYVGDLQGTLRNASAAVNRVVADAKWRAEGNIWLLVLDGFYHRIVRLSEQGGAKRIELPLSVAAFDVSRTGAIAFVGEDFAHLPEIYLRDQRGVIRQLSHVQQGWGGVTLAPTEIFRTATSDGFTIEAALIKPAGTRLPLVLLVHGGPASHFSAGYGWETAWGQLLATRGYQVLMVNPRGSNGYSEAFLEANRADWGGGDYRDLVSVLDAVIARGDTDPARLGIGGWSYGGEMTAWAITQTHRFRAAVFGAGVFDQAAEFEAEADPSGDEWYFGTPWEHPEVFARNSPSTYIRAARTPTLILVGEQDPVNPIGQSKGLYRALKHFGVETQMVVYPGEGHSPRRGSYNIDMFERILEWYDRHLTAAAAAPGP
jgi:dipeptidyl aminopeptidase/acylaminoacyl peptidase